MGCDRLLQLGDAQLANVMLESELLNSGGSEDGIAFTAVGDCIADDRGGCGCRKCFRVFYDRLLARQLG